MPVWEEVVTSTQSLVVGEPSQDERYDMAVTLTVREYIHRIEDLKWLVNDLEEVYTNRYGIGPRDTNDAHLPCSCDHLHLLKRILGHYKDYGTIRRRALTLLQQQLDYNAGLMNLREYMHHTLQHVILEPDMMGFVHRVLEGDVSQ